MNIIASLEKRGKTFWTAATFFLIAVVGLVDYLTGYELSFSLFYLIPISLAAWFAGRRLGAAASVISAVVWSTIDFFSGAKYSHPAIYIWNGAIRFGFFIVVTLLLAIVKEALEHEKKMAHTDYLTGATSPGFFYDLLQMQMDLFQRYKIPFTLAYIDIDNFKTINDQFGHPTGDQVLHTIVAFARNELRKTDVVARLGGDEFAILLPQTDPETAQTVVSKIQQGLLREMNKGRWPVTFSIGMVTFKAMPVTPAELIKMADDLMYGVKRSGKNAINYAVYAGQGQ